ncbi:MAG: zf-HC2 domain-containing protein [Pyrinomonadaceae bacterium]
MNCEFDEKLSSFVDGELSESDAGAVQRHLMSCKDCELAHTDFLSIRNELSAYPTSIGYAEAAAALAHILSSRQSDQRKAQQKALWSPLSAFAPAWAIAAVLVVGSIIALIVYRTGRQPPASVHQSTVTVAPAWKNRIETSQARLTQQTAAAPTATEHGPLHKAGPLRPAKVIATRATAVNIAAVQKIHLTPVRAADTETLTAMHLESAEVLLRAFRNLRSSPNEVAEFTYERQRAQQLVYKNMMLRREADVSGDIQLASLLQSLEPILLDIATLPADAHTDDVRAIQARVERKNIIPLLQVNSSAIARALD